MKTTHRFLAGCALIAALLALALDALYPRFLAATYRSGLAFGVLATLAHVTWSFFALSWGGRQADKRFLTAFAASLLGRLLILGIAILAAYRVSAIDFKATLITLVIAFFPLAGYEAFCVVRGLDLGFAGEPSGRAGAGSASDSGAPVTTSAPPAAGEATPVGRGA